MFSRSAAGAGGERLPHTACYAVSTRRPQQTPSPDRQRPESVTLRASVTSTDAASDLSLSPGGSNIH
jgi:hypothetical protein